MKGKEIQCFCPTFIQKKYFRDSWIWWKFQRSHAMQKCREDKRNGSLKKLLNEKIHFLFLLLGRRNTTQIDQHFHKLQKWFTAQIWLQVNSQLMTSSLVLSLREKHPICKKRDGTNIFLSTRRCYKKHPGTTQRNEQQKHGEGSRRENKRSVTEVPCFVQQREEETEEKLHCGLQILTRGP